MSACRPIDPTRREALATAVRLLSASVMAGTAFPTETSAQATSFPKGAVIRTLFKDYAPEELAGGATMFHEHVQLGTDFGDKFRAATNAVRALNGLPPQPAPAPATGPQPPDPRRDPKLMAEELNAARRDGIACLVDAGHPDMGRDIEFSRQAAMLSGLPVVAGAGFYSQPYYPKEISTMSEEQIVRALVQQVDDFPAGVFGEIGSWDEMTKDERKVFRAIGKAHVATNLSILTHTGIPGKAAIEQLDILEDAGVNPNRIVIGHLGNLVDPNVYVHKTICRRGAFAGFDRQGGDGDAQQVPLVMALLEAGFEDNLLFSADQSRGFGRTLTAFLPKLKAAGAGDAVLHKIMVDNPRRFLAFVPKRPRKR
jgi:phosphotriesterase-related protein